MWLEEPPQGSFLKVELRVAYINGRGSLNLDSTCDGLIHIKNNIRAKGNKTTYYNDPIP